jgi:signal transduction histidine kinase/DNA-binding response OmpR family regulator
MPVLQNLTALAFVLLGLATAAGWVRRRDRSLGWLALAIILLSLVALLGRIPALIGFTPPLLSDLSLIGFVGSGYALLRFRGSLIPLARRWHVAAAVALAGVVVAYELARLLIAAGAAPMIAEIAVAYVLILVWAASILEPIVRFWLVARGLPALQAWRLRALSLGFAGLVAVLLFAISAGAFISNPAVQVLIQLVALAIVPLLYVSFAPPAWLRRQWRANEEEGLRQLMEDLLVLKGNRADLFNRALDCATRLVGASAIVAVQPDGTPVTSRGLEPAALAALGDSLRMRQLGRGTVVLGSSERATLTVPLQIADGDADRLVLIAGPFTPAFGGEESSRADQFVTAMATAFDRSNLIDRLEATNIQLLEANQHKSVFLANMSHELRTPLNAILGFSELLSDDTKGRYDAATQHRFLDQIHSSGKHLLGLINDILDLSKVEAGQMDLRIEDVMVDESVRLVLGTVEPLARTKNIVLDYDSAPGLKLLADPAKLKQMLLNLVSNAIKFTPNGGRVTIHARQTASWIEIAISDTGIGIAQSDLGRLFTEFQQLDAGPGREQEGTGLGLSLTKRFAELHGGHVLVRSVPGEGSTFILQLPVVAKKSVERPVHERHHLGSSDPSRPLVLLVEDNPEAAEILARHLESGGFRLTIARTGKEALTMAQELKPVAITLDILLPEIDGWEVLTQLKADKATRDIPVLIVTVVDNPALGRALGALDYFVKPVDRGALLSRLDQYTFTTKVEHGDVRVLVVDDEPANVEALVALLQPAGFKVLSAGGGKEGIDMARRNRPDLILLDLLMPEVTGFDVVEALRSDETTRAIPIMVLTAKELNADDKRALNGNVAAVFQRNSVGGAELVEWLRGLVAKRHPR